MTNQPNPIDVLINHLKASQASLAKLVGDPSSMYRRLPSPQLLPGQMPSAQAPYPGPNAAQVPAQQVRPEVMRSHSAVAEQPLGSSTRHTSNPFDKSLYKRSASPRPTTQPPLPMSGEPLGASTVANSGVQATTLTTPQATNSTAATTGSNARQGASTAVAAGSNAQHESRGNMPRSGSPTTGAGSTNENYQARARYRDVTRLPIRGIVQDGSVMPDPDGYDDAPFTAPLLGSPAFPAPEDIRVPGSELPTFEAQLMGDSMQVPEFPPLIPIRDLTQL